MIFADPATIAALVDASVAGLVLVFGSLPPDGRDLDLLVRPAEQAALAVALAGAGLIVRGRQWAAFHECSGFAVDVMPASDWSLDTDAIDALFADASPVPGYTHLVQPSPHHALLVAARRLARDGGELDERWRARLDAIAARDAGAWERAAALAPAWGATAAFDRLAGAYRGATPDGRVRLRARWESLRGAVAGRSRRAVVARVVRTVRPRPAVVAFSGLDGAGKSHQATALQATLERLGATAVVVWPPAGNVLFQLPPPLKRALWRAIGRREDAEGEGDGLDPPPVPTRGAVGTHVLATLAALAQVLAIRRAIRRHRRCDVVICDRYVLDAVVYLRQRWGAGRRLRVQCAGIRALSPRPDAAFLLAVTPETAFGRKQDFSLENLTERAALYDVHAPVLHVRRLDGARPPGELCEEIARSVWPAVG